MGFFASAVTKSFSVGSQGFVPTGVKTEGPKVLAPRLSESS
jgi:hypothetical protein